MGLVGILSVILRISFFTVAINYSGPVWKFLVGYQPNMFWSLVGGILLTLGTQFYLSAKQATVHLPEESLTEGT